MYTVSITSQGQISIPAQYRKSFDFNTTNKATVTKTDEGLLIRPIIDFLGLAGSLKTTKKPLTNKQTHDLFEKNIVNKNV